MNDAVDNRRSRGSEPDRGLRGLLESLTPVEQLTGISGRFGRDALEQAFLRDNMRVTRQFLIMLAVAGLVGALMSAFAAMVSLPHDTVSYRVGLVLRMVLAGTAAVAIILLERARQPWHLLGLNAGLLLIGLGVVALRMSEPGPEPDAWSSLFHVTRDGMTVLLVVTLAQLALIPGWFVLNTAICGIALVFYNGVVHFAPDPPTNPLNLTYASTVAFLFILGMGTSVQRLRRSSFLANIRLRDANFQLNELATQDPLTSCANRRHFYALAEAELARSRRYRRGMSVIVLDLDHFKAINDRHGHAAGDVVLAEFTARIRDELRELDSLGRIGGEEFALLLPETGVEEAATIAERLRETTERMVVEHEDADLEFTASFGVAVRGSGDRSIDALMKRADFALYEAKKRGRNRVVVYEAGEPVSGHVGGPDAHRPLERAE